VEGDGEGFFFANRIGKLDSRKCPLGLRHLVVWIESYFVKMFVHRKSCCEHKIAKLLILAKFFTLPDPSLRVDN
jgi:hypothetical protein